MKRSEIARVASSLILGTIGLLCFTVQETPNSLCDIKVVLIGFILLMIARWIFPKGALDKMVKK